MKKKKSTIDDHQRKNKKQILSSTSIITIINRIAFTTTHHHHIEATKQPLVDSNTVPTRDHRQIIMNKNQAQNSNNQQEYKPTMFQISMGLLMVGASAGLTLYTKKTRAMLDQMKRVERNREMRLPKRKFGPLTRDEWERTRSRWNDYDDGL